MERTDKMNTYVCIDLWNEANRMELYAVDMTGAMCDACLVFKSDVDRAAWIKDRLEKVRPYGITMKYDVNKPAALNIINQYEHAEVLKIENGRVWIA